MILVNLQGSDEVAFSLLKHADWNGLTVADLVFPWFILIVGLSLPFAFYGEKSLGVYAIAKRAAILLAIGVVLGWLIRPTLDPEAIRFAGVLQRIAIVYFICALAARQRITHFGALIATVVILTAHTLVLLLVNAPGEPLPSILAGEGISAWSDRTMLPGRLHRVTWDPEGALSTLPSVGTAFLGLAVAKWRKFGARDYAIVLVGAALVTIGLMLTPVLPLNKALWTASFALVASGSGLIFWIVLGWLWRNSHGRLALTLPIFAGRTALTLYVLHMLLIVLLVRTVSDGTIWSVSFDALKRLGLNEGIASLLFAAVGAGISLAPLQWLRRRKLLLRV